MAGPVWARYILKNLHRDEAHSLLTNGGFYLFLVQFVIQKDSGTNHNSSWSNQPLPTPDSLDT